MVLHATWKPRRASQSPEEPDRSAYAGSEREQKRSGESLHLQLIDMAEVIADAMSLGESTQIDMNSIELDTNPGRHRDSSKHEPGEQPEPSGFQTKHEDRKAGKLGLTVDRHIELEGRQKWRRPNAATNEEAITV